MDDAARQLDERVAFEVVGQPVPQGSLRAIIPRGQTRPVIIDGNAKALRPWRALVVTAARAAMDVDRLFLGPFTGPVGVRLTFRLKRPQKAEWTTPAVRPDLDKLIRGIGDALTIAGVVKDDAQIVKWVGMKVYAETSELIGVSVEVVTL